MRLQSDPTMIYGLVGGKGPAGAADQPRRRSRRRRAYNTYASTACRRRRSPIPAARRCAPCSTRPTTEELYFVADGSGGHVFSRTLSEHSEKVKEWRKFEEDRRIAEEASAAAAAAATTAVTEAAATAVAEAAAAAAAPKDISGKVEAALATGGTDAAAGQGKAADGASRAAETTAKASAGDGGKAGGNETGKVLDAAPETRLVTIAGHVVPLPKAKPRQD